MCGSNQDEMKGEIGCISEERCLDILSLSKRKIKGKNGLGMF